MPQKQKVTLWKCPDCFTTNLLENACNKCHHTIGDLNMDIDLSKILIEADEDDLDKYITHSPISSSQITGKQEQ